MKPGSCGPTALGIYGVIYDEDRNEVPAGSGKAGNICIRNPWPGIMQTIWGQPERFIDVYYRKYNADPDSKDWHDWPYFAGDGAVQAADGYYRILGRVDDVINVAGHRLGTKELESGALTVERGGRGGRRAGGRRHPRPRGRDVHRAQARRRPPRAWTPRSPRRSRVEIGKIARPKNVWIVPDMPKTRSGKIMRRVIAAVSNFTDVGDVTTLANPEVVEASGTRCSSAKWPTRRRAARADRDRAGRDRPSAPSKAGRNRPPGQPGRPSPHWGSVSGAGAGPAAKRSPALRPPAGIGNAPGPTPEMPRTSQGPSPAGQRR